jgi:hypothetical protein
MLPAYWFLGLFNQLNGSMHPELVPLAHRAWVALGLSALGAIAALLLSYLRTMPKIVEQPDILPGVGSRSFGLGTLPGSSLGGIITLFSLRTLLRSRQHRMILSFYVGIGLTIILGFIHTRFVQSAPASSKSIQPTSRQYSHRLTHRPIARVIAIPILLRANWIFRVTRARPAYVSPPSASPSRSSESFPRPRLSTLSSPLFS